MFHIRITGSYNVGLKDLQLSFQFQLTAIPYVSKLARCRSGFSKSAFDVFG